MMGTYSKAAIAVLALALSCSPLLAQGDPQDPPPQQQGGWSYGRGRDGFGRGRGGMRGFGMRDFGLSRLLNDPAIRQQVGITADQAAKISQQTSDFRKAQIRDRADIQVKRIDLQDLLSADKPDRAAIDAKLQEISTTQLTLSKSAIDYQLNMREAITPAQRDKLRQLMRDRGKPGDGRSGGGPPRPGPQGAGRRGPRGSAPPPNSQGRSQSAPPAGPPPNNQ
jgi:Spy/CpxP family protein refolding chaperone